MKKHSFQMEHAPRGASAAFSIGCAGQGGGFSVDQGLTGSQDIYLGFVRDGQIRILPYFNRKAAEGTGMAEFIPTGCPIDRAFEPMPCHVCEEDEIQRDFGVACDSFRTDGIRLFIYTPTSGIPDPATASAEHVKEAIAPALTGELCFDNHGGESEMIGFFALGGLGGFRLLDDDLAGLETLDGTGFAVPNGENVSVFSDRFMDLPFRRPEPVQNFCAEIGGFMVMIPAGESVTLPLVFGWYRPGIVTLGKACRYYYTQFFDSLADVLSYGLNRAEDWKHTAEKAEHDFQTLELNDSRKFLHSKALRSYWGSTQLLLEGDRPRWVVNEGSCNMMNTLDLTVDMAFLEAELHPWLLRNVLDSFVDEYSYTDAFGLSFTHDQGYRNVFSAPGVSHYETRNQRACFSFMTHEELLNWILTAAIYVKATNDRSWGDGHIGFFEQLLASLLNRDHRDPAQRNGVMGFDSDRCGCEAEITTYDSLDPSLGQARNNAYIGVKCWAAYRALDFLLQGCPEALAGAKRAARTICEAFDSQLGYIPAILEGGDCSAIIPIVEALIYPHWLGLDPDQELNACLRKHIEAVLAGPCRFEDGGWKLSGNNDNSWMSKIFICQAVAEHVLGLEPDVRADLAHEQWWRVGCAGQSVIDQVVAGKSAGSGGTYPRCVTTILFNGMGANENEWFKQ
jgi:hypothetical protein